MSRAGGAIAALALLVAGCTVIAPAGERDDLRARIDAVTAERDAAVARAAELEAELAARAAESDVDPEVRAATPRLATLAIDRATRLEDRDDDGTPETLVLGVVPRDGRGRFLQVAGTLRVHVALLPDDGDARTLGRLDVGPRALREAWRGGFTSARYELTVVLDPGPLAGRDATNASLLVRATLEDGWSGGRADAEGAIVLPGGRAADDPGSR